MTHVVKVKIKYYVLKLGNVACMLSRVIDEDE